MMKKRPRKKIFLERETKYRTFQIESETQKNHPRIVNVTNKVVPPDTFGENKKEENNPTIPNAKDDKEKGEKIQPPGIPQPENEKEEGNIPYSCIPQLEKNDKSYFWDCYA